MSYQTCLLLHPVVLLIKRVCVYLFIWKERVLWPSRPEIGALVDDERWGVSGCRAKAELHWSNDGKLMSSQRERSNQPWAVTLWMESIFWPPAVRILRTVLKEYEINAKCSYTCIESFVHYPIKPCMLGYVLLSIIFGTSCSLFPLTVTIPYTGHLFYFNILPLNPNLIMTNYILLERSKTK